MKRSGKRKSSDYFCPSSKPKEYICTEKKPKIECPVERPNFGPSQVKDQWNLNTGSIVVLMSEMGDGCSRLVRIVYMSVRNFVAEEFLADGSARRIHHGFWVDYSVNPSGPKSDYGYWNSLNWIRLPTEGEVLTLQKAEATWMSKKLGVGQFANRTVDDIPQTIYVPDTSGLGMRQLDLGKD